MDIDEYYENYYEGVINSGFVGRFSAHYHRLMEREFENQKFERILELGAGKGQHLNFVKCNFEHYLQTDIRLNNVGSVDSQGKSHWAVADAQNLSNYDDIQFERTIATCLIAHLSDPEKALREWRRVTSKNAGIISLYLPCEPSFLLRLAQSLSTRRKASKIGLDYSSVHYREHRNHYFFIKTLIMDVFQNDKIKIIGFPNRCLPFDLKLYEIFQIELVSTKDSINE